MSTETRIKWKVVIFYGIFTAAIILLILYVLGNRTPVKAAFDSFGAWISSKLSGINFPNIDFGKIISENFPTILGVGITGIGALITYAKYRGQIAANEQLLTQKNQLDVKAANLESNVQGLATTVSNQAQELEMYSQDKTPEILQGRIDDMKQYVQEKELEFRIREDELRKTIDDLHSRLEQEIEDRPVKVEKQVL